MKAEVSGAAIIQTEGLSKRFGSVQALDHATLTMPSGCTGLLGPNGAGKSTLIRLLLGLLAPDSGEARVADCDARRQPQAVRALVGYMPEHDCLPSDWLAQDFVRYMGELHGLPQRVAVQRANDTLYHVGLGEERFRPIGGFSTGMKQRVKLAQALVHDPRVVLLDEPTNGLDPSGRDEMLAPVNRVVHEMEINVILTSHVLVDVERVADHVVIINGGRVVVQGALHDLMAATPTIVVRTQEDAAPFAAALRTRGYALRQDGGDWLVERQTDDVFDAIRDAAVETGTTLLQLKQRSRSLEDVYLAGDAAVRDQQPANTVPA